MTDMPANASENTMRYLIAQELKRRASAMSSLLGFTRYTFPGYRPNWHHKLIAQKLDAVLAGTCKRLMLFMPPRHGKTELAGRRFPAYAFGRNPNLKIVSASYSSDLARATNRDVQRIIDDSKYNLVFPSTRLMGASVRDASQGGMYLRNADEFEIIDYHGHFKAVGVTSGLTGRGFNIGIIDDPVKDRLEASSETYRNRVYDWFNSVFFTRRENDDAAIVLIQTRWHQDDLAGRLLAEKSDVPWEVVSIPAIQDSEPSAFDLRKSGEALWPQLFPIKALREIERQVGAYEFSALYQQRPTPKGGQMFNVSRFKIVDFIPGAIKKSVRYWDKAGSAGSGCYTAGVLMHECEGGVFCVADVVRGRWEATERERIIKQTANMDGRRVRVWVEQEPGSGGKESAEATIRNLSGYSANADRVTGDKEVRAEPYAAQVGGGNVYLLNGREAAREWHRAFLDEHETFPTGKYKDQVDASAGAFNKLAGHRKITPHVGSIVRPEEMQRTMTEPDVADIFAQATPEQRKELEKVLREELVSV